MALNYAGTRTDGSSGDPTGGTVALLAVVAILLGLQPGTSSGLGLTTCSRGK